jgi:hypothetical protein
MQEATLMKINEAWMASTMWLIMTTMMMMMMMMIFGKFSGYL